MAADSTTLKIRYPDFAAVDNAIINYWLIDCANQVGAWSQPDADNATMALAAHNMALAGYGSSTSASMAPGVTHFKSGTMDVSITEQAANARVSGDLESTRYGKEFALIRRRNVGGPLHVMQGVRRW